MVKREKTDNRLRKPTFPDTTIGGLLKKADKLKYDKIYNYKYSYFIKTPNGMREDIPTNHKYGNERQGYDDWSKDHSHLAMSYAGVTSVREMYDRKTKEVVGYMFEEKLSNTPWLEEIDVLLEEAWISFCNELNVKDTTAVEYFLFEDMELDWRDNGQDRIMKFKRLINVIEQYNDEDEENFKHLFDKIKG